MMYISFTYNLSEDLKWKKVDSHNWTSSGNFAYRVKQMYVTTWLIDYRENLSWAGRKAQKVHPLWVFRMQVRIYVIVISRRPVPGVYLFPSFFLRSCKRV